MATTWYKMTEQAMRLIKGGNVSAGTNIVEQEVKEYMGQVMAKMLKTEYFSINLPSGETIPAGCLLATYDNIKVEQWKGVARAKLPAMPMVLPRNMGIFHVGPSDDPTCQYIPVQIGQTRQLQGNNMFNEVVGITYETVDAHTVFSKDISAKGDVMMQLVIMDLGKYDEYAPLPIGEDMQMDVINITVQRFLGGPVPDKVVDSGTEPTKV